MIVLNFVDENIMKEIHDNSFPLPDLSDPNYICKKMIVVNGNVAVIGLVKLTCEGILISNSTTSVIDRTFATVKMIKECKQDLAGKNLRECHAFVKDDKVVSFLKALGFVTSKGGRTLIIQF